MRKAEVYLNGTGAGILTELATGSEYLFEYHEDYSGPGISRTMPTRARIYRFSEFPPFFDGLLPEGIQLEGLLKIKKIDRNDFFSQLIAVGQDMVGAVTIKEIAG
jgi:serine/threonine-protein kinase HipA